ncbi:MAG: anthranilate synthase component I family protein [Candidatus Hadarchaeales archaeon]
MKAVETLILRRKGCPDPARFYLGIRGKSEASFLLESAEGPGELARYSVVGYAPLLHLRVKGGEFRLWKRGELVEEGKVGGDPLELVRERMFTGASADIRYLRPVVGYVGYDYVRSQVELGNHTVDDLGQPELEFVLPERVVVFDGIRGERICAVNLLPGEEGEGAERMLREMEAVEERGPEGGTEGARVRSNVSRREFERMVEEARRYIHQGDAIQVVLSRRMELVPSPPPEAFYFRLRKLNPSPYLFMLDFPGRTVMGSSPELQVKVEGGEVSVRPIAGTRRRGEGEEDERLEEELKSDEKERAEHVMLVDLARNDVGRVSEFGSVRVTEFMKVEKYSHVQHLVSHVTGKLRPGVDALEAFRATFPAGTVTGAPKVRAMEIIEELEPTRRGIYAGAVGVFGPPSPSQERGTADFAIAIRTMVVEGGKGYVQVGAGVVADSEGWKEYLETRNKGRALLLAAGVEP